MPKNKAQRKERQRKILARIMPLLVRSLRYTVKRPPKPCIIAIWHEEILPAAKFISHYNSVTLVSPSKDASAISMPLAKSLNITPLRFSSGKRESAVAGVYGLMKYDNHCIVMAVDGSRGPRRKAKAGIFVVAKRKQIPVYACRFSYKGFRINSTWDKTKMPYPFAFIKPKLSEPFIIGKDDRIKDFVVKYEAKMAELGDD